MMVLLLVILTVLVAARLSQVVMRLAGKKPPAMLEKANHLAGRANVATLPLTLAATAAGASASWACYFLLF